tara:strand:- start:675 stop:1385 length:711 start_codon:yes stop_codon:yes gene_type:complete
LKSDPLGLLRSFKNQKDLEIMGLFLATLAWGNRKSIIQSGKKLIDIFENEPYYFVKSYDSSLTHKLTDFKHRTFNSFDLHFFIERLRYIFIKYDSLEQILSPAFSKSNNSYEPILTFRSTFLGEYLDVRSKKHIANPSNGSAAKRLNMYLRWMVRKDNKGVDLGIWSSIPMSKLSCPIDVHSGNTARKFNLISRRQNDWKSVVELDENLRKMDPNDPVKYDFALFGYGVKNKKLNY